MSPTTTLLSPSGTYEGGHAFTITSLLAIAAVLYYITTKFYSIFLGPLAKFPGPRINAFTKIPRLLANMRGEELSHIRNLHQTYGPVVRVSPDELSFINGADAWRDIHGFKKPGQPKPFKDRAWYGRPLNKVDGIITADDANHSRQRKIFSNAFSDRALREQEPILMEWTMKLTEKLSSFAASGDKVDMLKMLNCTTFDIMGDLSFNESLGMLEDGEYSPWVKTIFASIKEIAPIRCLKLYSSVTRYIVEKTMTNSPKLRTKAYEHFRYTSDRVERRLKRMPERPDLWTRILSKGDEKSGLLTLDEHKSNAALLMVAGTETTATALSGLTYYLTMNLPLLERLTSEIRSEIVSTEGLKLENLARLKYLQACLMEALRMYPPVPIGMQRRIPEGGAIICGEWVPGGTAVSIPQQAVYSSPEHFKNPDKFDPERWLGNPEYAGDHRDAMEPFSTGPRNCLGKNLAWHEMRLLMSSILLNFDIKLAAESRDWVDQKVYTLWEKRPLICTLTPAKA